MKNTFSLQKMEEKCIHLIETPINTIIVPEYLQNDIDECKKFLICSGKNELIKYKSDTRKLHFKHKNYKSYGMTKWQDHFEDTKFKIENRRGDAIVNEEVLEFQHIKISKELVDT